MPSCPLPKNTGHLAQNPNTVLGIWKNLAPEARLESKQVFEIES